MKISTIKERKIFLIFFTLFVLFYSFSILYQQKNIYNDPHWYNDDVRNISYYLHRLNEPELFQDDYLAEISSRLAPIGWKALYRSASFFLDPFIFSKILTHILYVFSIFLIFMIGKELKNPVAGAIACLLYMHDPFQLSRMAGGLPRAFFIPLILLFLFFYIRNSLPGLTVTIFVSGLLYPITLFYLAVFAFISFIYFKKLKKSSQLSLILVSFFLATVILVFTSKSPGKMISFQEASQMPEFYKGGKIAILPMAHPVLEVFSYFFSPLSGLPWSKTYEFQYNPENNILPGFIVSLGLFFTSLWGLRKKEWHQLKILIPLIAASLFLYFFARIFFFKLYYPYRYLYPLSLPVLFIIGTGLSSLIEKWKNRGFLTSSLVLVIFFAVTGLNIVSHNSYALFEKEYVDLFHVLSKTPKDSLIAGNPYILDSIPMYSKRKVFINDELSIPFFKDTYPEMKKRHLINAEIYYSNNREDLLKLCSKYNIDYIIVFKPDLMHPHAENGIFYRFEPFRKAIMDIVSKKKDFYLYHTPGYCIEFESKYLFVVNVNKIENNILTK